MTIKEMETRTGLVRANIRFYEDEGLITPQRRPNGYRDYSKEDEEVLLRVKLLRTMQMPLDEIKAVHCGDCTLTEALDRHLEQLTRDKSAIQRAREVCLAMREAEVSFETLDAGGYLSWYKGADLSGDVTPKVKSPWRRYFARSLDVNLYALGWELLRVILGYGAVTLSFGEVCLDVVVFLMLISVLEPFFLSQWGTTPGKFILGLSVTGPEGERLSYFEASRRTGLVLWKGMGLGIPIINLIRECLSFRDCKRGETLAWEEDTVLVLKDEKFWRILVFVVAFVLLFECRLHLAYFTFTA